MAGSDPNLKIRIETDADLSAAKASKQAIKEVGQESEKTGEAIVSLGQEAEKTGEALQKIEVPKPLPGAADAEKKLIEIRKEAEGAADAVSKIKLPASTGGGNADPLAALMAENRAKLAAMKQRADALGASGGSSGAPDMGGGAGQFSLLKDGAIAGAAIVAAGAVAELVSKLNEGVRSAADMAVELQGMDEAARQAAVQGMGPLGQLIAQNSPLLVDLSQDLERCQTHLDGMWTAAGVRLAPALSEVTDRLAEMDLTGFGEEIGQVVGGIIALGSETVKAVESLDAASGGTGEWTNALARMQPVLAKAGSNVVDFFKTLNAGKEYELAFDPERLAAQEAQRLDTIKRSEAAIAAVREDAARTSEEKIAKLREKQENLKGVNSDAAAAIEREIIALQKRANAEADAIAAKKEAEHEALLLADKRAEAAAQEALQRIKLNEAIAAGNEEERKQLEVFQEYQTVLKQTGDSALANRAAQAREAVEKRAADAIREQIALEAQLAQAKAEGDRTAQDAAQWRLDYNAALKRTGDEQLAQTLANAQAEARGAQDAARAWKTLEDAKREAAQQHIAQLQAELAAQEAVNQAEAKTMQAEGKDPAEIAKAEAAALTKVAALRQKIADLQGKGAAQATINAAKAEEAAAKVTAAEREKAIKALEAEAKLQKEIGETRVAQAEAQGKKESEVAAIREADLRRIQAIEQKIADLKGEGAEYAAKAEEDRAQAAAKTLEAKREEAEKAEKSKGADSGISAPTYVTSPNGPSGLDPRINLNAPTQPRDLAPELTPKGSDGYGTGPGAGLPPAPPVAPPPAAPATPPAAPAAPAGDAQQGKGEDVAAQVKAAVDEAEVKLQAAVKEMVAGVKAIAAKQVDGLKELQGALEQGADQQSAAIEGAGAAAVSKGAEIILKINQLEARIENLTV